MRRRRCWSSSSRAPAEQGDADERRGPVRTLQGRAQARPCRVAARAGSRRRSPRTPRPPRSRPSGPRPTPAPRRPSCAASARPTRSRHYTAALALSPRDEAAMLGRAQALAALDRRPEAADAYDSLAELRAASGKLADAVDAARRALELAEGRERRRMLEQLIERLRATAPGEPGRVALERALRVLDGPAVADATAAARPRRVAAATPRRSAPGAVTRSPRMPRRRRAGRRRCRTGRMRRARRPEAAAGASSAEPGEPTASRQPIRAALDRDLPDDLDVEALMRRAEEAITAGRRAEALADAARPGRRLPPRRPHRRGARRVLPRAVAATRTTSPSTSGSSSCTRSAAGRVLATEKLDLLDRLVALDDGAGADRVAAARAARG